MPFSKTENNKKIGLIMIAIIAVCAVLSFGTQAFAQSDSSGTSTVVLENNSGLDKVIKGTENWHGEYDISIPTFLQNIGKSTGIYKMVHRQTAAEIAAEKEEKARAAAAEKVDPFADANPPGWQYLVMIIVGFVVIWLGAGMGFDYSLAHFLYFFLEICYSVCMKTITVSGAVIIRTNPTISKAHNPMEGKCDL